MITKHTIDKIFEAARIEEVIGEFVHLKRTGSNYKGLSPFTDERTPSFVVSPSKQIFKDFSSGKGGNVVTFLMEHEQMSYPEALKYLAQKYNIEIEETEFNPEQAEAQSRRESLYIVSEWAEKLFMSNLHETNEGKSIGLSYFKERGFTEETIKTFRLGYAINSYEHMVKAAEETGYNQEYLLELGLIKKKDGRVYDGFKGRVMFPIHNLSGRPLGFGGRTLLTEKRIPKYVNSPECDIYHKSKIVYGIYQAKKHIVKEDVCFLVEGYTDVISLHQSGIKNVVASSGTALTSEQVRLIGRYSKNITILYDSDPAGIKASFRGIDLILAEGLNVKVALLPEGEDPDSFAQTRNLEEIKKYFATNVKDFILFKTQLLADGTKDDPMKLAGLVRNIIESIAIIPDSITRSVYTKECSNLLEIPEKALISELNKIRTNKFRDKLRKEAVKRETEYTESTSNKAHTHLFPNEKIEVSPFNTYYQEKDILRLMLNYGQTNVSILNEDEEGNEVETIELLAVFVNKELQIDKLEFSNELLQTVFQLYLDELNKNPDSDPVKVLINNPRKEVRELVVDLVTERYQLHNWKKQKIEVYSESDKIFSAIKGALYAFKARKVNKMIEDKRQMLKDLSSDTEQLNHILSDLRKLDNLRRKLLIEQGITIFR